MYTNICILISNNSLKNGELSSTGILESVIAAWMQHVRLSVRLGIPTVTFVYGIKSTLISDCNLV